MYFFFCFLTWIHFEYCVSYSFGHLQICFLDQKNPLQRFLNFPKFEYCFLYSVSYIPILSVGTSDSKMSTFNQRSYHTKCQHRGLGGQKSQNLVNVVCEWPLIRWKWKAYQKISQNNNSCKPGKPSHNSTSIFFML